jgi:CO/xanthine dehydrogenase FAD-binding subunit
MLPPKLGSSNDMKPAKFDYYAPNSIEEALELLVRYDGEARVLAGGQSLVPMMNFRLVAPAAIVDLNRIASLTYIRQEADAVLIGAMTRQRTLQFSDVIRKSVPLLQAGIEYVGHLPTRSRGTIGGSIAHADPAAEIPMVLRALEATVVACGQEGKRTIALGDLFVDAMTTSLGPAEILTEVKVPVMPAGAGFAVKEFSRRQGDFAIAAIAAIVIQAADGRLSVRLSTGGISAVPERLRSAEAILEREGLTDAAIKRAADAAAQIVEPLSDQNGSADYRRELTRTLTRRALSEAAQRIARS